MAFLAHPPQRPLKGNKEMNPLLEAMSRRPHDPLSGRDLPSDLVLERVGVYVAFGHTRDRVVAFTVEEGIELSSVEIVDARTGLAPGGAVGVHDFVATGAAPSVRRETVANTLERRVD